MSNDLGPIDNNVAVSNNISLTEESINLDFCNLSRSSLPQHKIIGN